MRTSTSSGSPFEAQIGFTRGVRVGDQIFISGTAPIGPDGKTAGVGDIEVQTRRCLEIIEKAIVDLGGQLKDVVRTRIFLTDVSIFQGAAKAHGEFFSEIRPASSFIGTSALVNPEWLVEIEADAIVS